MKEAQYVYKRRRLICRMTNKWTKTFHLFSRSTLQTLFHKAKTDQSARSRRRRPFICVYSYASNTKHVETKSHIKEDFFCLRWTGMTEALDFLLFISQF